jgi:hypothetical protein
MGNKNILYRGVPQQVLSESVGAIYPDTIARQDDGKLAQGSTLMVPYDPVTGLYVNATLYNASTVLPEVQRTPTVFKLTALVTASGDTAVWTPATGKKFRVLGGQLLVSAATTTATTAAVTLKDGATNFLFLNYLNATNVAQTVPFTFPGNGYLSTAVNTALNLNLGAVLTAGGVALTVWGTEE